jgi:uncharacterized membrane protein
MSTSRNTNGSQVAAAVSERSQDGKRLTLCVMCSHELWDKPPLVGICDRCKAVMRTARLHGIEEPHAPITTNREFWLPTTRVNGHEVSNRGRVRSRLSGKARILKAGIDAAGYPYVGPWTGTGNIRIRVHTLVLEAWCGPKPSTRHQARHYDDRKRHKHIRNLSWGTRSENIRDMVRNGHHNNARKRKCLNGHRFTPENTRIINGGGRECRACHRERSREQRAKRRAAAALSRGSAIDRPERHGERFSALPRVTMPEMGSRRRREAAS